MRGIHKSGQTLLNEFRITPAHAGNTDPETAKKISE